MLTAPSLPSDVKSHETPEIKLIEDSLSDENLKPGSPRGFVVYRVAYGEGTDARWSRLIQTLEKQVDDTLLFDWKMKTLRPRHQMVLMDERERFQGLAMHEVRRHFRSWVADELKVWLADWRADRFSVKDMEQIRTGPANDHLVDTGLGTRYNICVYVDDECLESLDHESVFKRVIKLVWKDWVPPRDCNGRRGD